MGFVKRKFMHRLRSRFSLLLLLVTSLMASSCDEEMDKPKNLISESEMIQILTEVQIAEAKIGKLSLLSVDSSNLAYQKLESTIFKKYKTDSAAYKRSFNFYAIQPEIWAKIYEGVVKNLEVRDKKKDVRGI